MTKQEIIDYVMTTPSNPNKAVLEGMLDSIADAGGGSSIVRMTLFDNTLSITQSANSWIYQNWSSPYGFKSQLNYRYADTAKWIVNVDGEEIEGTLINSRGAGNSTTDYYIGADNPGDTPGTYKIGCHFAAGEYIVGISMVTLDASVFSTGEHSVKVYVELSAE